MLSRKSSQRQKPKITYQINQDPCCNGDKQRSVSPRISQSISKKFPLKNESSKPDKANLEDEQQPLYNNNKQIDTPYATLDMTSKIPLLKKQLSRQLKQVSAEARNDQFCQNQNEKQGPSPTPHTTLIMASKLSQQQQNPNIKQLGKEDGDQKLEPCCVEDERVQSRVPEWPAFQDEPRAEQVQLAEKQIPCGLIIMATDSHDIRQGFPYPRAIEPLISEEEWKQIGPKLAESGPREIKNRTDMAYHIEQIMDTAALMNVKCFRPRGLLFRLDCPGEMKYGLDFMEIEHDSQYHLAGMEEKALDQTPQDTFKEARRTRKGERSAKRKGEASPMKYERLKEMAFSSLRIVLDPISVLKIPEKATARGWTQWKHQCTTAFRLAQHTDPPPVHNRPWDFCRLPSRRDRWPPSKHLYYERFRGRSFEVTSQIERKNAMFPNPGEQKFASMRQEIFVPDWDSMDQRVGYGLTSSDEAGDKTIVPCDEVVFEIMRHGKLSEGKTPRIDMEEQFASFCKLM